MIKIDFSLAISLYLFFTVLLVTVLWISYNWSKDHALSSETKHIEQCPYCTHVFFNYRQTKIPVCPRCKSYLEIEKGGNGNYVSST